MLSTIQLARAQARDRAWTARGELTGTELPGSCAADQTIAEVVIDLDATLVSALGQRRCPRELQRRVRSSPLGAWLDNTGEALAMVLRPGNAGSNTAADHLTVPELALSQVPDRWGSKKVLIRADGAGYSHAVITALSAQQLEFSVATWSRKRSGTPSAWRPRTPGRSRTTATAACGRTLTSWKSPACSTCPAGRAPARGMGHRAP